MKPEPRVVWAVQLGNYFPPEVLALYDNEAAAKAHRDASSDPLEIVRWEVENEYRKDDLKEVDR